MFRNKTDPQKISAAIGYEFKTNRLLLQALTRTSALGEGRQERAVGDFQRLEFVGDKILGLVIADLLYDCYPTWKEGQLTQESSVLVRNRGPLAEIARKLGLGDFLIMGRGEESLGLRDDDKVLSDAMEALLGALWIDTNHDYTFMRQFIQTHWSALGLLPTVRYEQLIQLLHCADISTADKVTQLKRYLQQHLKVPVLNQFLLALVAHSGSGEEEALSEVVAMVLEKGVTQDTLNTALIEQLTDCLDCSPQTVDLLLRYKADPNTRKNPSNFSLLQSVILQFDDQPEKRLAVVQSLLRHGADPNWRNQSFRRKVSASARMRDEIKQASAALAEELSGLSPIFAEYGNEPCTYFDLLARKAKEEKEPVEEYQPRKTALHYACEQGKTEEIMALADAGADARLPDVDGNTPLHCLIQSECLSEMHTSDHQQLVHALLSRGASSNQQNNAGDTPLHLCIRELFKPLHLLFNIKPLEVLKILVEAKANIKLANQKGNTILHEMAHSVRTGLKEGEDFLRLREDAYLFLNLQPGRSHTRGLQREKHRSAKPVNPYYERLCLLSMAVTEVLPLEDMLACMEVRNIAGETPQNFFRTMVIPRRLVDALSSQASDDDEEPVSPPTHPATAEDIHALTQQVAAVDLAESADTPTPSQSIEANSAPINPSSSAGFFPIPSRHTTRSRLTRSPARTENTAAGGSGRQSAHEP